MAIEGVKQLADEDRRISGYTIIDTVFSSPLTISLDSDGVEVELYIRHSNVPAGRNSIKYDFKVCANINGRWNENCSGTLELEYEAEISEVDGGKEAAAKILHYSQLYANASKHYKQNVCLAELYKYLRRHGLDYGPDF